MRFVPTALSGVFLVEIEVREDSRGLFARTFCREEFGRASLPTDFVQCNTSYNVRRGTLRGMHFQASPFEEGKLVRCTRGAIYDVTVDLRTEESSYLHWIGVELTAENRTALYIPPGIAHGFQTLADETEVFYQMTEFYVPNHARGLRWNDPRFGITWPVEPPIVSERDTDLPNYDAP